MSVGLAGHAMSSVADQHKSAQLILYVGCPNHGEVVLQHAHVIYTYIQVIWPKAPESRLNRTYSCYNVFGELPVCPFHHLVAVVVCVQGPVALQGRAGSKDHFSVQKKGSQRVGLLQPVTRQSAPKAFWDTGGDGVGIVLITFLSGRWNNGG